ncbi:MAG: DNA polymerase IV [Pirellulaceae bacterium]|nr:DNA polymerase IV [Pirellulaceae bacterium]
MILHVDMDAFYAAVEQRDRPELADRPVIVGGSATGRGVIAAASYAARRYGIHSAMPTATALRLCPQAILLPVRMSHYADISRQIRDIFHRYTPLVEPLSLDEAFLDVSGCRELFGSGPHIARRIKDDIRAETGLVASVGVAPNKFLAKIASDLEKPDALVVVDPLRIEAFLDPLPIGRLWGVGKVTEAAMRRLGVETIGQLRLLSVDQLRQQFGEGGEQFWRLARGIDQRSVVPDRQAQQISHETTFARDLTAIEPLRQRLWELTDQVARRLRRSGRVGRTVQLKLRLSDFRTITRSQSLAQPSDITAELWHAARGLLDAASSPPLLAQGIRLIGFGVSGLSQPPLEQQQLFADDSTAQRARHRQLDHITDAIQARFGSQSLTLGRSLTKRPWESSDGR